MSDKKHPGTICISRWHGNQPPYSGVTISLTDGTSGTRCVEIELTLEAFAKALFSSQTECEFDHYPENVGKTQEKKMEIIQFKGVEYKNREAEAKATLAPYEVDGWKGDWRALGNHHCGSDEGYHVGFTRYVQTKP